MNPNRSQSQPEARENKTERTEIVVFVTASSAEEAEKIARTLVEAGLAACANILSPIKSIFVWEQKLIEETETLIVLKTKRQLFSDLAGEIKRLHSYQVPEIIAFPIVLGSEDYLNWIAVNTRNAMK